MLVVWVRAVCMLSHEGSSTPEFGDWRFGEGVKQVILA